MLTEIILVTEALNPHVLQVVFDMETGDPDDVWTLLILASHPRVQLCADAGRNLVLVTFGPEETASLYIDIPPQANICKYDILKHVTTLHRLGPGSAESDASYSDAWHILAAFDPRSGPR